MRRMELCERTRKGDLVVGIFATIPEPGTIEVIGRCGFDYICFDGEHSPIDRSGIESLVRAAEITQTPAFVRVPGSDPIWIATAMDAGALGVIVPRIDSGEEAAKAAAASRYPPFGSRGAGPGRASQYGADRDYQARSAAESLLAVQIETPSGLANVESIANTEGVDIIFVGPGDLGISLRAAGRGDEVEDAIKHVFAVAKSASKVAGIFCRPDPEVTAQRIAAGATFLAVGSDKNYLATAARASVQATRALVSSSLTGVN